MVQNSRLKDYVEIAELRVNSRDYALITCAYMSKKGMEESLFGDDLRVLTDESAAENDNKCFKKIPGCCKFINTEVINIRQYLEFVTYGKIEVVINNAE